MRRSRRAQSSTMEFQTILWPMAGAFFLVIIHYAQVVFRKGLRNVPGPFWARVSSLYRVGLVYRGDGVQNYRQLHEKYGPVVRTGPYHVSVSDPSIVPLVYGIASKFRKVSVDRTCNDDLLTSNSLNFTA